MEGMVMDLKDIMDLKKLQDLQNHYEEVTGLKAVIVGKTGESLTYTNNFRAEEGGMTIPVIVNEEKNKMNRKGETTGTNDRNILQNRNA